MEALAGAGLMPLPSRSVNASNETVPSTPKRESLYPELEGANATTEASATPTIAESMAKLTAYPSLVELKSMIDEQAANGPVNIEPPSIEPLEDFLEKRAATIEALKDLRGRMAKHVLNCKISNTVGNSASIIGGILCFVFPPVGVPVLLVGSATSLGKFLPQYQP